MEWHSFWIVSGDLCTSTQAHKHTGTQAAHTSYTHKHNTHKQSDTQMHTVHTQYTQAHKQSDTQTSNRSRNNQNLTRVVPRRKSVHTAQSVEYLVQVKISFFKVKIFLYCLYQFTIFLCTNFALTFI